MKRTILLAIDIGNTDTVIGLFRGSRLAAEWRAPSLAMRSAARAWQTLRLLLAEACVSGTELRGAVVSSVVPANTRILSSVVKKRLGITPYVVSGMDHAGIRLAYRTPETLGPDRICNAAAARARHGAPVIVVDIGTAITYDVVTRSGAFAGGAIAPGFATMAASLNRGTAALPAVAIEVPKEVIGRDTVGCIQSGIMYGTIDAIAGMIGRIRKVTGARTPVILTGGYAELVGEHLPVAACVEPALVLEGARILFERRRRP